MKPRAKPDEHAGPDNNTVKLPAELQRRVALAMRVEGFSVWSEFCRVALTEKCHAVEDRLRLRDPVEHGRVYEEESTDAGTKKPCNR
jgi:hypothetical protein